MRHSDSRGALPPPGGRRIPPTASPKPAKAEDRPNARDLLASVNSASSGASTSWIAFLGAMAYLAVTLSGITHVDLLLDRETTLPFVGVKVPLTAFFVAAPLAFVLVHFGLLLQHVVLSRKLRAFEERLWKEQPARNRREQPIRDELHSYSFTQSVSGMPKGAAVDMALRLVMSLTLVVFPLLLLTFFQIGFLPYHSEPITWWHRIMLLADATIIVVLIRYMARRFRKQRVRLADWRDGRLPFRAELVLLRRRTSRRWLAALRRMSLPIGGRDYGSVFARVLRRMLGAFRGSGIYRTRAVSPGRLLMGALLFFSACVATLPDEGFDRVMASIPISCQRVPYGPQESILPDFTRCAFFPTAYLFERNVDAATGKADSPFGWSRNLIVTDKTPVEDEKKETRLNLRGRDLRYARLDRSNLKRADFFGARLERASLVRADLNASDFRTASLQGADLRMALLQRANLSEASLQGANLLAASLQGAGLFQASLQGAGLFAASLQGAGLSQASLQGANLSQAWLQGADLSQASLQGADLSQASLQGASLSQASLQGADLSQASLQGASLSQASLQGADLSEASLQGADLSQASLQGVDLSEASLQGADLSQAKLWRSGLPGNRGEPVPGDEWDVVSFVGLNIGPHNDDQGNALAETIAELEKLAERMAKENADGRAHVEFASKRVADKLRPLFESEGDETWKASDLRGWCKLAQQPQPDTVKLSTYLGTLARDDDTDKAYMAQRLIRRALALGRPHSFLEAFKESLAFGHIPADLKSQLERAAQQERESAANAKPNPEKVEQPEQAAVPEICAEIDNKPAGPTTGSTKPTP